MTAALVAVLGTDTGCGKTVATAALAAALLSRGRRVAALKPVATGVEPPGHGEDAELLAAATGVTPADCSMATYRLPRSPLAAARAEGRVVGVDDLVERVLLRAADPALDILLVEGVGGLLVPLTERLTVRDLVRRLDAPVLLVARAGLGTINHTALTVEGCRGAGLDVVGVILVDVDAATDAGLVLENAARIAAQCGVEVLGTLPHLDRPRDPALLTRTALAALDLDTLEAAVLAPRTDHTPDLIEADRRHLWHPFTQTSDWLAEDPLVVRSGTGCRLRTVDGREYIDAIGALWANVHGYGHPGIDEAIREQVARISHATLLGQTHEPASLLAAELAALTPAGLTRVFLSESGASAVEVALRVALLAQRHRGQHRRTRFLSLEEAYHGDTAGSVSIGRSEPFHRGLGPLLFDALRTAPPHLIEVRDRLDPDAAEATALAELEGVLERHAENLAALVIEPRVQGAAGIWTHSDAWLREAVTRARAAGALVICDEVATGFGRTGDLFASAGAGVVPDILCLGKGLSGGYLPISATVVGEDLFDLFTGPYEEHRTLSYGHTFSGNPLACAAARASLRALTSEDTVARGRRLGQRLGVALDTLAELPLVAAVRRRGVMCGVELAQTSADSGRGRRLGREVTLAARRRGVIVRPLGDVVVLNPALVMTDSECDTVVAALAAAIADVAAGADHERPGAARM